MCSADGLTEFARLCIERITFDGLAGPQLLIVDGEQPQASPLSTKLRKAVRFESTLWYIQSRLFPLNQIPAYRREPLESCLANVPSIVCVPQKKGKWSQYFSSADVDTIKSHELDFILRFGFGIIRGDVLNAAKYGVWSFHHDDEDKYRGGPPAFWELYQNDPVSGAMLQRLTDTLDGGIVLKKCSVPTNRLSYRRNLQRILHASTNMVRWVCVDLANGRADYLNAPPSRTKAPIYHAPNDFQMLRFWAQLGLNWLAYKKENQCVDVWNVGVVNAPQAAFLDPAFVPEVEWTAYSKPDKVVADPFLVPPSTPGGPLRIVAEELDWYNECGTICELRRDSQSGKVTFDKTIIDEGVHMSYPFIFQYNGDTFMVPEAASLKAIVLYRMDRRTGEFQMHSTLIDNVNASDSTLFEHDCRWWLIHTGNGKLCPWSLYVWHAATPFGPWEAHTASPVKTDVSSTRPAGNPFVKDGQLYRPAQDNRHWYGYGLTLNRIDELTTTAFRETVVRRIGADPKSPYPDGCHALAGYGNITLIDGKRHRWPLGLILRRIMRKRLGLGQPKPALQPMQVVRAKSMSVGK